ncbi:hypothetical protein GYB62_03210 [bacterium]|nr:hypothetical protein [bacterium]
MTQLYARRQRQHAVSAPPRARVSTLSLSDLQPQWLLAAVIGLLLSCAAALAKAETIRPDDNASTISSVNFTAVSQAYYDKSKGPDCVVNRYTWAGQSCRDES